MSKDLHNTRRRWLLFGPGLRETASWTAAFGLSTVVHVSLMALLACFTYQMGGFSSARGLDSRWGIDAAEIIEDLEPIPIEILAAARDERKLSAAVPSSAPVERLPQEVTQPETTSTRYFENGPDKVLPQWIREDVGGLLSPIAAYDIEADGAGPSDAGGFFGIEAGQRRVVYVLDSSKSMNLPHASRARTRFNRLKLELLDAIATLDEEDEFFIVFFNDEKIPMPARSLKPVLPDNRRRYLRWAAEVRADGDTDPRAALEHALHLQPDVIYLLTDGEFPPAVQHDLENFSQQRVIIHTIALGNRAGEPLLKRIAHSNRGRYRFVP